MALFVGMWLASQSVLKCNIYIVITELAVLLLLLLR